MATMSLNKQTQLSLPSTTPEFSYQSKAHFEEVCSKFPVNQNTDTKTNVNPYIIFVDIDQQTYNRDLRYSDSCSGFDSYYPKYNLLIVEMISKPHEAAAGCFQTMLLLKLAAMGVDVIKDLHIFERATVKTTSRDKSADKSYMPKKRPAGRSSKWPTFVVEVGWSEPKPKLDEDVRWWLKASNGDVKAAWTIDVNQDKTEIVIETWSFDRQTRTGPRPGVTQRVRIWHSKNGSDADSVRVSGGRLKLAFQDLFLRDAKGNEDDIFFETDDLIQLAQDIWEAAKLEEENTPSVDEEYVPVDDEGEDAGDVEEEFDENIQEGD
jgi:hypothetical protein